VTSIVLAALSALVWGTADFFGGKASQRASALTVSVLSKALSLPVLALYLVLLPAKPQAAGLAWALGAGVVGMVGLIVFYYALAMGAMVVVAPISAVLTALVPMVFGLAVDQVPAPLELTGAAVAVVAIVLVSIVPSAGPVVVTRRMVAFAVAAGLCFGSFFVLLERADSASGGVDTGLWPIAAAQIAAVVLGVILVARQAGTADVRASFRLPGRIVGFAAVVGVLDMTANALYLLAVQGGTITLIAPIAALYPASTVVLALLVDRERIWPIQVAGLGLAATAIVLVVS
jgi:drug/metabolite transporter (DMT)-like permease